jgi:HEAT repeat protein
MRTHHLLVCLVFLLGAPARPAAMDVYQVVRTTYYHGIPYELAHGLGPEAVPTLLELLGREEEREHWANIVLVLGMIGDDRATEPLIDFLERRFTGEVDPATYRALLEVPASLGFLARDPSSRAFAYLRDGTSLEAWQDKGLRWTLPALRDEDRAVLMVRRSITGLGLSGSEAAREHLKAIERSPEYSRLRQYVEDNVTEAIQTNERIQSLGYQRVLDEEIQRSEEGQKRQERQ